MIETIDQVVTDLDRIVDRCWEENSRLGYFPAMYRNVTSRIKTGVEAGEFEDNERMERLDVVFASRYLTAVEAYWASEKPTRSWAYAFGQAEESDSTVLHHLLLGMNAHINLDLAIAAADVSRGHAIEELENDFTKVNNILAGLVDEVQEAVDESSVIFRLVDRWGGRFDEAVASFGITQARKSAWETTCDLHRVTDADRDALVLKLDKRTARFAATINPFIQVAGLFEELVNGDDELQPREVIDVLNRSQAERGTVKEAPAPHRVLVEFPVSARDEQSG